MRAIEGYWTFTICTFGASVRAVHALSCHVLIADVPPSASDAILQRLNTMLAERFHISHTTVQFEHASCAISEKRLRHSRADGRPEGH